MRDTKCARAVVESYDKGYRVSKSGKFLTPKGKEIGYKDSRGYICTKITLKSGDYSELLAHQLQAYQKFGDRALEEGVCVRHLNSDQIDNSYENISIGTHQDNMQDKPREIRLRVAKQAASHRRKLTEEQVRCLRKDRSAGMSYKELSTKYGIAKSTVAYIVNHKTYIFPV